VVDTSKHAQLSDLMYDCILTWHT